LKVPADFVAEKTQNAFRGKRDGLRQGGAGTGQPRIAAVFPFFATPRSVSARGFVLASSTMEKESRKWLE
jgi:hypothetical protein